MTDLTAPVDPVHDECRAARAWLRAEFMGLQAHAKMWEPRPIPPRPGGDR